MIRLSKPIKLFSALLLIFSTNIVFDQDKGFQSKAMAPDSLKAESFIYTVGPDDVLAIEVYDNPDLTGEFTVSGDGNIVFPLLGQTKVSGLNVMEIQEILTHKLEKDYLYNPIVSVGIKLYRSKTVYILGNVGKPGVYYLERPTRLFDLLSKAEGLSQNLGKIKNGQRIHIIREAGRYPAGNYKTGKDTSFYISLHQFLIEGKRELNIYVKEGDVIYIPGSQSVHVIGEVKKPGSFPYEEGMTVLKAITLAGGSNVKAADKNTVIKRIENNKEIKIKVSMGDLLKPDDIVEVPLSIW